MNYFKLLAVTIVAVSLYTAPLAQAKDKVISFSSAKKKLYKNVFNNSGRTIYCDCDWSKKKTDLSSCGLQSYFPKKQRKRAARTEAEHIIPASWYLKVGHNLRACAAEAKTLGKSPRKHCQKTDRDYKQAHNDLVNLWPAVGQINADRSNKPFVSSAKSKVKKYASCDIEIGSRGIAPSDDRKGDIARIAFYMEAKYSILYSKRQRKLFEEWDALDPVSDSEIAHNKRVVKAQGFGIVN